jgi:hypothetical protein
LQNRNADLTNRNAGNFQQHPFKNDSGQIPDVAGTRAGMTAKKEAVMLASSSILLASSRHGRITPEDGFLTNGDKSEKDTRRWIPGKPE